MMHIVSLLECREKAPTNALVVQAVRSCADRGISYLVYSKFAYGKKQTSSLSDFKERNGFKRVDVPRYYVPLTRWGSLALPWDCTTDWPIVYRSSWRQNYGKCGATGTNAGFS